MARVPGAEKFIEILETALKEGKLAGSLKESAEALIESHKELGMTPGLEARRAVWQALETLPERATKEVKPRVSRRRTVTSIADEQIQEARKAGEEAPPSAEDAWRELRRQQGYDWYMWGRLGRTSRGAATPKGKVASAPETFKRHYNRWLEGGQDYISSLYTRPREQRELMKALGRLGLVGIGGAAAMGMLSPDEAQAQWYRRLPGRVTYEEAADLLGKYGREDVLPVLFDVDRSHGAEGVTAMLDNFLSQGTFRHTTPELETGIRELMAKSIPAPVSREEVQIKRLQNMFPGQTEIQWRDVKRKAPATAALLQKSQWPGGAKVSFEDMQKYLVQGRKYIGEVGQWTGAQSISSHFGMVDATDQVFKLDVPGVLTRVFEGLDREAQQELVDALGSPGLHPGGIGWVRYVDQGDTRIIGEIQSDTEERLIRRFTPPKPNSDILRGALRQLDPQISFERTEFIVIQAERGKIGEFPNTWAKVRENLVKSAEEIRAGSGRVITSVEGSKPGFRGVVADQLMEAANKLKELEASYDNPAARRAYNWMKDWKVNAVAGAIQDAKEKGLKKIFIPEHSVIQEYNHFPSERKFNEYYRDPMKKIGGWQEANIRTRTGPDIRGSFQSHLQTYGLTDQESWAATSLLEAAGWNGEAGRRQMREALKVMEKAYEPHLREPVVSPTAIDDVLHHNGMSREDSQWIGPFAEEYWEEAMEGGLETVGYGTLEDFTHYLEGHAEMIENPLTQPYVRTSGLPKGSELLADHMKNDIRRLREAADILSKPWDEIGDRTVYRGLNWNQFLSHIRGGISSTPFTEGALQSRPGWLRDAAFAIPIGLGTLTALAPGEAEAAEPSQQAKDLAKKFEISPEVAQQVLDSTQPIPYSPTVAKVPEVSGFTAEDPFGTGLESADPLVGMAALAHLGVGVARGLSLPFRGISFPSETLTALGGPPEARETTLTDLVTGNLPLTEYAEPTFTIGKWLDDLDKGVAAVTQSGQAGDALYKLGELGGELAIFDGMFKMAGWFREALGLRYGIPSSVAAGTSKMVDPIWAKMATLGPAGAALELGATGDPRKALGAGGFWAAAELTLGALGKATRLVKPATNIFTYPLRKYEQHIGAPLWEKILDTFENITRGVTKPAGLFGRTAFKSEITGLMSPGSGSLFELVTPARGRMPWLARRALEKGERLYLDRLAEYGELARALTSKHLSPVEQEAVSFIVKGEVTTGRFGRAFRVLDDLGINDPGRRQKVIEEALRIRRTVRQAGLEYATRPILRRGKMGLEQRQVLRASALMNKLKFGTGVHYFFDYPKEALRRRAKSMQLADLEQLREIAKTDPETAKLVRNLERALKEKLTVGNAAGVIRNLSVQLRHASRKQNLPEATRKLIYGNLGLAERTYKGLSTLARESFLLDFYHTLSRNKDWVKNAAQFERLSLAEQGRFVRMPDNVKWGMIRNQFVQRDIAAEIHEITRLPGNLQRWFGKFFLSPWKVGKVLLRPSTHFRNMYSNAILNYLGGLGPWRTDIYMKALREYRQQGPIYKAALENGALGKEWYGRDLAIWEPYLKERNIIDSAVKMVQKGVRKTGQIYQGEEQVFKLAKYIHNLERGMNPLSAGEDAVKWTLNYAEVSPLIRGARETVMPFATFTGKAIPVMLESMVKTPWRWAGMLAAGYELQRLAVENLNMSEDEWNRTRQSLPEYVKDGYFFMLPFRDNDGRLQWLDLTYILPWGDVAELGQRGPLGWMQNPLFTVGAELWSNQTYTGRPIWEEWMTPVEKTMRVLQHMYQQFMPSFMIFGYDWEKAKQAGLVPHLERIGTGEPMFEESQRIGAPTTGQFMASQVGLKTFARGEGELVYQHGQHMKTLQRQIRGKARRRIQEYPSERNRAVERARRNLWRLLER